MTEQELKKSPQPATVVSEPTTIVHETAAIVKQTADIDGFIQRRQEFIQKVSAICVEGKDYHVIQNKKSLAKGGAEKIASIFQWNARFEKDAETLEMLGSTQGLVAFKCTLAKGTKYVGEGRGAAMLAKNSGDPNKTIKMAQKSAFIDAVLRASGLSDFFTQDLEDMPQEQVSTPTQQITIAPSQKQLDLIESLMTQKRINPEDLPDYDLKNLTGGKEGTASKLINHLMMAVAHGSTLITDADGLTEGGKLLIADLQECNTQQEYERITQEVKLARQNKKLSGEDWNLIKDEAQATVERIKAS